LKKLAKKIEESHNHIPRFLSSAEDQSSFSQVTEQIYRKESSEQEKQDVGNIMPSTVQLQQQETFESS